MTVTEPATMVTDYVLALLCAFFAVSLRQRALGRNLGLWVAAFSVTAVAALTGGTAHGFRLPLGNSWALVWRITVVAIALGSTLLVAAGARSAIRPEANDDGVRREGKGWLKRAIAVSLVSLVVLVLKLAPHRNFNHNDLYHVIQAGGLFCLYRGALSLHGLSAPGRRRETGS